MSGLELPLSLQRCAEELWTYIQVYTHPLPQQGKGSSQNPSLVKMALQAAFSCL